MFSSAQDVVSLSARLGKKLTRQWMPTTTRRRFLGLVIITINFFSSSIHESRRIMNITFLKVANFCKALLLFCTEIYLCWLIIEIWRINYWMVGCSIYCLGNKKLLIVAFMYWGCECLSVSFWVLFFAVINYLLYFNRIYGP